MRSRFFLYVSLGADILIAISKFIGASLTKSSSMMSEGIHSLIDSVSQVLLIWGVKSSKRKPDDERPFGYGRELYFWSFIVSLIIFILGGCISFYQGIIRFKQNTFYGDPDINYIILGIAFLFTLISMLNGLKAFNKQRGEMSFWKAVINTKDPSTIIVVLGDFADLSGLIIAFLGIFIGRITHDPHCDGIAAIIIGFILILVSALLIRESKSLLMGETISRKNIKKIIAMVEADKDIAAVKKHFSIYRSPEDILLQLNAVFKNDLTTRQITDAIERVAKNIQEVYPRRCV